MKSEPPSPWLTEDGRRELTRRDAIERFALSAKTADDVLKNLVRKPFKAKPRCGHLSFRFSVPTLGSVPPTAAMCGSADGGVNEKSI